MPWPCSPPRDARKRLSSASYWSALNAAIENSVIDSEMRESRALLKKGHLKMGVLNAKPLGEEHSHKKSHLPSYIREKELGVEKSSRKAYLHYGDGHGTYPELGKNEARTLLLHVVAYQRSTSIYTLVI